jgi:hypothetical protein
MTVRKLIELLSKGNPWANVAVVGLDWSNRESPRNSDWVYVSHCDDVKAPGQKPSRTSEPLEDIADALGASGLTLIDVSQLEAHLAPGRHYRAIG